MHVVLAGGGTAGHIEPALNLADELRADDPTVAITALGTAHGLESRLVPARGYHLALVPAVPLPRRPSIDLVRLPVRLRTAVSAVRTHLDTVGAGVVVGFGGYVAMPAYLAARNRIPIVVHEANARAGVANRIGARFTDFVACAVPGALPGARHIGLPLRRAIIELDRTPAGAVTARRALGLEPSRSTLVVTGGSQGARRINDVLVRSLDSLLAAGHQVLHITGPRNVDQVGTARTGYVSVPYLDHMEFAYAAADLLIGRGGAMTCAELAALGLPALIIPLPIGNGEQSLNAAPLVARGQVVELADDALSTSALISGVAHALDLPPVPPDLESRNAARDLAKLVYEAVGNDALGAMS